MPIAGRALNLALFMLCAAPVVAQAVLVPRLGVNVVISDEWSMIPFVHMVVEGGDWPGHLFDFFNENRFAVPRLLLALTIPFTGWNAIPMMYLSVAVSAATVYGLWRLYRGASAAPAVYFVPVAWIAVGLAQYQNLFWAFQISFLLTACGVIWTLIAATRQGWSWLAGAIALALFTTFTSAGGTMIWPTVMIVLIGRRARPIEVAVWIAAMVATAWFYARGYRVDPADGGFAADQWIEAVRFFLILIGAPLAPTHQARALVAGCVVFGIAVIAAGAMIARRQRPSPGLWGVIGLVAFGVIVAALTTYGRVRLGAAWALTGRYVTFSALIWIGVYVVGLALLTTTRFSYRPAAVALALGALAIVADVQSWRGAVNWGRHYGRINKFVLQTRALIGPAEQAFMLIHPAHSRIAEQERAFLARHRLSFFQDPVAWWLLVDPGEAMPLRLTTDVPVVQSFVCPVETLHDVAIGIAPGPGAPSARLRLELIDTATDALLGSRAIVRADTTRDGRYVLRLDRPLPRCNGRDLQFIVTPAGAAGAFVLQHFRADMDGALRAPEVMTGRGLGIELNTDHFDIRDLR